MDVGEKGWKTRDEKGRHTYIYTVTCKREGEREKVTMKGCLASKIREK